MSETFHNPPPCAKCQRLPGFSSDGLCFKCRKEALPDSLPLSLARRIGAAPDADGDTVLPSGMLDWALHWAKTDLHIFPCKKFLGLPIEPKWYSKATSSASQIVEWWSETHDADIAAVPELSGHFVLVVTGPQGADSFETLEEEHGQLTPEFGYENRWGDQHLWFKGKALTSHNVLGPGLHVIGAGHYVYLSPSLAPDPIWS